MTTSQVSNDRLITVLAPGVLLNYVDRAPAHRPAARAGVIANMMGVDRPKHTAAALLV